jgi:hypothetical protein
MCVGGEASVPISLARLDATFVEDNQSGRGEDNTVRAARMESVSSWVCGQYDSLVFGCRFVCRITVATSLLGGIASLGVERCISMLFEDQAL